MWTIVKRDLLSLVPSLRAFAFCLTQDRSRADDLLHSALIGIWSAHKSKRGLALKIAAFNVVYRQFLQGRIADPAPAAPFGKLWPVIAEDPFASRFRRLPLSERAAVSLVDAWGFDLDDAAEICGCDRETIRNRTVTARYRLTRGPSGPCQAHPVESMPRGWRAVPLSALPVRGG